MDLDDWDVEDREIEVMNRIAHGISSRKRLKERMRCDSNSEKGARDTDITLGDEDCFSFTASNCVSNDPLNLKIKVTSVTQEREETRGKEEKKKLKGKESPAADISVRV